MDDYRIETSRLLLALFLVMSSASSYRTILVTGGNKGIGKAICTRLLQEWPDTQVVLGSRSLERGQQAVDDIHKELNDNSEKDRLKLLQLDTAAPLEDIQKAANALQKDLGIDTLYGVMNNAGIMGRDGNTPFEQVLQTNYHGPRNVNTAFRPFLLRYYKASVSAKPRIVNVASAAGPIFVSDLEDSNPLKAILSEPWKYTTLQQLDKAVASCNLDKDRYDGYGCSKALLSAYTCVLAQQENPNNILVHCVTPGWILTDMTRGSSAKNPPSQGAIPPCFFMMDEDTVLNLPITGRYYGSDCVRSPLDVYRGPGDPAYEDDRDLKAYGK